MSKQENDIFFENLDEITEARPLTFRVINLPTELKV